MKQFIKKNNKTYEEKIEEYKKNPIKSEPEEIAKDEESESESEDEKPVKKD